MKLSKFAAIFTSVIMTAVSVQFVKPEKAEAAENVVISPYGAYQSNDGVFQGWGTSLCWWANRIGYSDSLSKQAAELFFGDTGLRMNIARFNIGGGDDPTHTHITRTDSDIPGYTKYSNGKVTYDWSADANQRNVLFKSIDACKTGLIVEMFSNSPPYYMTNSGCTSGNRDGGKNNLKDDCYDDFAEYFAEVCKHYQDDWGVNIQSASPMNEPYTNYWYAGSPKQEGCHFDIGKSESLVLTELDKSMKKRGLGNIIISASDETSIDTAIDAYNALSAEAKAVVKRIDTHTYGGSKRNQLRDLALKNNVNLWMSEVDGGATAGKNNGQMGAALWLAERMTWDLNGLNPSAWILWQAIDKHICAAGYKGRKDSGMPDINTGFWGLAVADHDKDNIILTQKYYAFGQFSRFIKPGSTMINVSGNNVAAYNKDDKQLVIVAVNTAGNNRDTTYDFSQFGKTGSQAKVIRTSGDMNTGEHWKELTPANVTNGKLSASILANSVTTFIIDDVDFEYPNLENEIPLSAGMLTGSESWKNDSKTDYTKTVDGDLSTYFDGLGNGYVQIDLGSKYDLSAIAFAPRSGFAYRCVEASVYVSSDGTKWTPVHKIESEPFNGLNYITHLDDLDDCKNVRYVKYQTPAGAPTYSGNTDGSCCCNIAEIKVYGSPAGLGNKIPLTADMVTGSDPWKNSANDCKKAVDGKLETFFDGVGNGWIQIDLGKSYDITSIAYSPRKSLEYRCVDAVISGSADGEKWTELYTVNKLPSFGMNYVTLDTSAKNLRYIKYQVPDGAPANQYNTDSTYCCNLAEIALYGTEAEAVTEPLKGDLNDDGKVDTADIILLQKWLVGSVDELPGWEIANFNDEEINVFDLIILKRIVIANS